MSDCFTIEGIKYVSLSALSFGDYGGAGNVGRANIDVVLGEAETCDEISFSLLRDIQSCMKHNDGNAEVACLLACSYDGGNFFPDNAAYSLPDAFHVTGDFSSECIYLREDRWEEELASLEDYPVLNDEKVSEIELQWESEAFDDWAEHDLIGTLPEEAQDKLWDMDNAARNELTWEAYRAAMETENEYPTPEYNGSHIPVDRIKEAFASFVGAALRGDS